MPEIKVSEDTLKRLNKFTASLAHDYDSVISDLMDGKTLELDTNTNRNQNKLATSTSERTEISFPIRKIFPDVTHVKLTGVRIGSLVLDKPNWIDIVVELLRIAKAENWSTRELRECDIRVYSGPRREANWNYNSRLRMSIPPMNANLACSYIDKLSEQLSLSVQIKWEKR